MLAEIGINERVARRLMSIGQNRAISNRTNWSDFPGAMAALYELSRMDPDDIERGIESGAMHARVSCTWCGLPWWAF